MNALVPPDTRGPLAGQGGSHALEEELSFELYQKPGTFLENLIVLGIRLVSFTAMLMVLLIFVFVTKESLPVIFHQTNNARSGAMDPATIPQKSPEELAAFLNLSVDQVKSVTPDVLQQLVASRNEEAQTSANPDSKVNTTTWRMMVLPYQWSGYDAPVFIWQPVGDIEKYNFVPLFLGSLKVTLVALLVAVPLALMSAVYVSQLASPATREIIKPVIEMLAGVPSVVLGFLGSVVLTDLLSPFRVFDSSATPQNALVAGVALSLAVIPVIFTIAEDAISAVPSFHKAAARAMGSTDWHATMGVVVPAAFPGVFAAVVLGFGRALGETMVVLLCSGNAATMDFSLLQSTRTVTATIAAELNEVAQGSPHYGILFLIGSILFLITFIGNIVADLVLQRLKLSLEGAAAPEEYWFESGEPKESQLGSAVV